MWEVNLETRGHAAPKTNRRDFKGQVGERRHLGAKENLRRKDPPPPHHFLTKVPITRTNQHAAVPPEDRPVDKLNSPRTLGPPPDRKHGAGEGREGDRLTCSCSVAPGASVRRGPAERGAGDRSDPRRNVRPSAGAHGVRASVRARM